MSEREQIELLKIENQRLRLSNEQPRNGNGITFKWLAALALSVVFAFGGYWTKNIADKVDRLGDGVAKVQTDVEVIKVRIENLSVNKGHQP